MPSACLPPGDQALFDAFALPGWVNIEEINICVLTCGDLTFSKELAEGNGLSVHLNKGQVVPRVGVAQMGVFRTQAFNRGFT